MLRLISGSYGHDFNSIEFLLFLLFFSFSIGLSLINLWLQNLLIYWGAISLCLVGLAVSFFIDRQFCAEFLLEYI